MIEIIRDCEQGSPEWFQHRMFSIGGTGIKLVMTKGKGKTRTGYLYKMAYQRLASRIVETYQDDNMRLGTASEPFARADYEWEHDIDVEQVALVKNGENKHTSPDGLCGLDGMIEIKNINAIGYMETITKQKIPTGHDRQIQWGLKICEREWCDFIQSHYVWANRDLGTVEAGYPDKPIWVKRVYRDEALIKEMDKEADAFLMELAMVVNKIRNAK
jgi:hypothetical protein